MTGFVRDDPMEIREHLRHVSPKGTKGPRIIEGPEEASNRLNEQSGTVKRRSIRDEIFEELGDLIDEAIEEQHEKTAMASPTPKSPIALRRASTVKTPKKPMDVSNMLHRSQSVSRHRRKSASIGEDTIEESKLHNAASDAHSPYQHHARPHFDDTPTKKAYDTAPRTEVLGSRPSPVKQTAAMFERLERRSYVPKAVHTPPIPLALPRLLEQRSQRGSVSSDYGHFATPRSRFDVRPATAAPDLIEREESRSWPFKWGMFGKTKVASPEETDIDALAVSYDEHKPSTSKVHDRVQGLLATASHTKQASPITTSEWKQSVGNVHDLGPEKIPQLQSTIQGEAKMVAEAVLDESKQRKESRKPQNEVARRRAMFDKYATTTDKNKQWESKILRQNTSQRDSTASSAMEKQVFDEPNNVTPPQSSSRVHSGSPVKREMRKPGTPARGRSRTRTDTLEQRFTLSRSRSHPKGVRVDVSVTASPERPEDEALVVIRAKVESLEDEPEE